MTTTSLSNKIKAFPVIQNQQDFLLGKFTIREILKFTKYTQRIIRGYDDDNVPEYNEEVQRKVEESRVKKIADFLINDPEATFPTNLVISIPSQVILEQNILNDDLVELVLDPLVFEEVEKEKKNPNSGNIFLSIIDGQHRVRGIELAIERLELEIANLSASLRVDFSEVLDKKLKYFSQRLSDLQNIELVVSFFLDKSLEYQAMIFSTINRTQKRVSQDLVYSLFGLTTKDSPQKTSLEILLALNGFKNSPFYNRIRFYGAQYNKYTSPPLSQATFIKSIVGLICENAREEENARFTDRQELRKRSASSQKKLPFRFFYANNKDEAIIKILNNYFEAVRETYVKNGRSLWDINEKQKELENILHTTVGFYALLWVMVEIIEQHGNKDVFSKEYFLKILKPCQKLEITNVNRYSFNNRGKKYLQLDMSVAIWPPTSDKDDRLRQIEKLEMEQD